MAKDNLGTYLALGLGLTIIGAAFYNKDKIVNVVVKKMSENKLNTLHPKVRPYALAFLNKAKSLGIDLRITSAYRDHEEQSKLYNQGRTTPGKIVTNAKAGQSSHNFGTAIDVVPFVNGKPDWNTTLWPKIAEIGKSIGFQWGGDWKTFKDKPHFEMNFGKSLAQLQNLYASNNLKNGYVNLG